MDRSEKGKSVVNWVESGYRYGREYTRRMFDPFVGSRSAELYLGFIPVALFPL